PPRAGGFDLGGLGDGRGLKAVVDGAVREVERTAIEYALAQEGGSPARAARLLGISRASIYNKIKELGVRHGAEGAAGGGGGGGGEG
ncbi:MAG: hypothetical protein KC464_13475, partial [Myxococcales bacterium]|nr:hypothetical protein [Myxococcales bacterium]